MPCPVRTAVASTPKPLVVRATVIVRTGAVPTFPLESVTCALRVWRPGDKLVPHYVLMVGGGDEGSTIHHATMVARIPARKVAETWPS